MVETAALNSAAKFARSSGFILCKSLILNLLRIASDPLPAINLSSHAVLFLEIK